MRGLSPKYHIRVSVSDKYIPRITPLGGWLVSILIGGEWHNSSTDFNPNTNSSILLQCKNKLQVHIKLTPTKRNPEAKYCMYYCMC